MGLGTIRSESEAHRAKAQDSTPKVYADRQEAAEAQAIHRDWHDAIRSGKGMPPVLAPRPTQRPHVGRAHQDVKTGHEAPQSTQSGNDSVMPNLSSASTRP